MAGFLSRLTWAAIALACVASPAAGQGRPLGIDDVLSMEAFGVASISPDGERAVYERRGPYDSASRFDLGHRSVWAVTDLFVVDLEGKGVPHRLLPRERDGGLLLGPWSPTGRRLLVYRLAGDGLEAGIADPQAGTVGWTGLTPDMPFSGAHAAWLDDDRLVLTIRPDGSLPWMLRHDGASQSERTRQWALMADGDRPSRTVVDTAGGVASAQTPPRPLQLVEIRAAAPSAQPRILWEGEILDVAGAPDGRWIAVLHADDVIPADQDPVRAYGMRRRTRLKLIDAGKGDVVAAFNEDVALHLLRWSANSEAVLVWARADGQVWRDGGLRRVAVGGAVEAFDHGRLEAVPEGGDIDELRGVQADWMGEIPVLRARVSGEQRFDWHLLEAGKPPRNLTGGLQAPPDRLAAVTERSLLMFADGALWRSEAERPLERISPPDVRLTDGSPADSMRALRLRINDAPRRDWAVGRQGGEGVLVVEDDGRSRALATQPMQGASMIVAASQKAVLPLIRNQGAETLWLSTSGAHRSIDAVNLDFANRTFARPKAVDHRDRLGRETRSWLTLPVGVPAKDVKGLVVNIYPGSVSSDAYIDPRVLLYGIRAPLLAAAGYAVLSPAMPEGGDEEDAGDGFVASVDLAVDAALKVEPDLPNDRIAILGHSFGGTAALAVAARSQRYQAYVAWSAGTDLFGKWGEFDPVSRVLPEEGLSLPIQMGWVETGQGRTGGPPWRAAENFEAFSPSSRAQDIAAPVLLITADLDFVPMSQSERIFTVLHRQGRTARLVTYWGEGHFNWSPANIRDLYHQILSWLDETLAEDPAVTARSTAVPPSLAPRLPGPPRS